MCQNYSFLCGMFSTEVNDDFEETNIKCQLGCPGSNT